MGKPAARVGDMHLCPMVTPGLPPIPHVGGVILPPGVITVSIGGMPAAGLGDICMCVGPVDPIVMGSTGVLVGGKFAARMGDPTAHGGKITVGVPSVQIGDIGAGGRALTIISVNPLKVQYGPFVITASPNDAAFLGNVIASLVRLDATPTMHGAFDAIAASGNKVSIHKYDVSDPWHQAMGPNNAYCLENDPAGAANPKKGSASVVAWDPDVHGFGVPNPSSNPGSDIILAHELVHATHNATGTHDYNNQQAGNGSQVNEERNTVGLPASTYNGPPNDPLNGTALPDTSGNSYTENKVRNDYANAGMTSPITGQPPVQRPSYGTPTVNDGPGSPF
jgi:uncharacterized Zn-binding protein involved in type VI secretion